MKKTIIIGVFVFTIILAVAIKINISGKTIITVSFHTSIDATVGPILIFIDSQSNKAIGTLPRM